jgi:fatty-acyl-CoA synthase
VALLAPNCAEYFELQFACGRLGAIMLPLNWRLTVPELELHPGRRDAKLLVHDRSFAGQAQALSRSLLEIDPETRTALTSARSPRARRCPPTPR